MKSSTFSKLLNCKLRLKILFYRNMFFLCFNINYQKLFCVKSKVEVKTKILPLNSVKIGPHKPRGWNSLSLYKKYNKNTEKIQKMQKKNTKIIINSKYTEKIHNRYIRINRKIPKSSKILTKIFTLNCENSKNVDFLPIFHITMF